MEGQIFDGNDDSNTLVAHAFEPFAAKAIRIYPL